MGCFRIWNSPNSQPAGVGVMLPFVVGRNESDGTEVWKEDLIFTFELSSVCPAAHTVQREAAFSPSKQPVMKKWADWPFKVNWVVGRKLRQRM